MYVRKLVGKRRKQERKAEKFREKERRENVIENYKIKKKQNQGRRFFLFIYKNSKCSASETKHIFGAMKT